MSAELNAAAGPGTDSSRMPLQVWILTLSAFAIGTAEFVIAGLLTQLSGTLHVSEGRVGYLITAYALAIVVGGPPLTILLARYNEKRVLIGLLCLFVAGNLVAAMTTNFNLLLAARVLAGLCQGPFYGIGSVVAARLVSKRMAGRAVGQMFAGLTLANVLGVPAGAWIGTQFSWSTTFMLVAVLGVLAMAAIQLWLPSLEGARGERSVASQLAVFSNPQLLASLAFTMLAWTGFMTFYGYIAAVAEHVAGFSTQGLTLLLVIVGAGLVLGNSIGGRAADHNLRATLILGPLAMILTLLLVGAVADHKWWFALAAFLFGIASFANVAPMQMRVMKYGGAAPELASTANISAFNVANSLGGIIGGIVIDQPTLGAAWIPYAAVGVPLLGLLLIGLLERKAPTTAASSQ